jgi:hypothetical protein
VLRLASENFHEEVRQTGAGGDTVILTETGNNGSKTTL